MAGFGPELDPFEEMVKLDYLYVTDWSLGNDCPAAAAGASARLPRRQQRRAAAAGARGVLRGSALVGL